MVDIHIADLSPVSKTLLIPLGCRAREFTHPHPILRDPRAVEVYRHFTHPDKALTKLGSFDSTTIMMRARQFDRFAQYFLELHPDGLVVDIGCGLDTRFDRLDNGRMHWMGIDLPEVIALRTAVLPDGERNRSIAVSMLDLRWLDQLLRVKKPVIFLAEGVFCYFSETDVKQLITGIVNRFPSAELAFDILSTRSLNIHNHTSAVLKDTKAQLKWAVDDPLLLEDWGLKLVDVWGYFDDREPRLGIGNLMRVVPAWRNANRVVLYEVG